MKHAHLLNAFYASPWHIRPEIWANFHQVLQRSLAGQEVSPVAPRPARHSLFGGEPQRPIVGPVDEEGEPMIEQMIVIGPVAVIPVHGALGKRLSSIDLWCGGCDYCHVSEFAEQAMADPSIESVLFDFDTPGGMSAGCAECGADIARLTAAKLTVAFSENQCCSAGYWLASQCREFWASPTAVVGNVGTILCGVDSSANWAQEGYKLELFASSPLKATGVDGKPWTPEDRAYLQERMMQCDARIKSAVRSGRPQVKAEALDGRWFFAENSLDLGVVDAITEDLDEALQSLLDAHASAR
jgi:protease-4